MSATSTESAIETALSLWQQGYERHMAGDLEGAIDLYRRSIAAHPTAEAHTFLGWAYHHQGRTHDAIAECQRAIEIDPTFGNPWNDIGAYLIELGRFDEAIPYLQRALRAERYECRYYPHFNLARIYERRGDWRRAIGHYEAAYRLNRDFTIALRRRDRLQALMN